MAKLTKRGKRREERRKNGKLVRGKNKPVGRLQERINGYRAIVERYGFTGEILPRRWSGFTRPGSMKK